MSSTKTLQQFPSPTGDKPVDQDVPEPVPKISRYQTIEFEKGGWYLLTETLGEGGYGKVKRAIQEHTQRQIAVKIIDLDRIAMVNIRKEMVSQRNVDHPNIVKFLGFHMTQKFCYIKLELCVGGELFDKIVPDHGMAIELAHLYFRQLLSAVRHMQHQGIVHRDLKPENVLIDSNGNVKVADFGFATVYKNKGRTRTLRLKCGTPPYVAPEVLAEEYEGDSVDLWSLAVILVAMLAGCVPWREPTRACNQFMAWCNKIQSHPWPYIREKDPLAFDLLVRMLNPNTKDRLINDQIEASPYMTQYVVLCTRFSSSVRKTRLIELTQDLQLDEKTAQIFNRQESRLELSGGLEQQEDLPNKRVKVDDDAEISINAEVANGKIATSHIATSHIAESTSVGFVRERPIENDANVVEGDDKWQLRVVQESCRTNFLRQSWFESTLPTGDILDRFTHVINDYSECNKFKLKREYDPSKPNILTVRTLDPHVGLNTEQDLVFDIRVTVRPHKTNIVDFMLVKGSGLHFGRIQQGLREMVRDILSTCAKPSQFTQLTL
eukprot:gene2614-5516_t